MPLGAQTCIATSMPLSPSLPQTPFSVLFKSPLRVTLRLEERDRTLAGVRIWSDVFVSCYYKPITDTGAHLQKDLSNATSLIVESLIDLNNLLEREAMCHNIWYFSALSACESPLASPSGSNVPSWIYFRQSEPYLCPGFCEHPTKVILLCLVSPHAPTLRR